MPMEEIDILKAQVEDLRQELTKMYGLLNTHTSLINCLQKEIQSLYDNIKTLNSYAKITAERFDQVDESLYLVTERLGIMDEDESEGLMQ